MSEAQTPDRVAIVGLHVRVPGASEAKAFWRNLENGIESIRRLSGEELARRGVPSTFDGSRHFVPAVAAPDGVEEFDAAFFGFSPREAEATDPQLRLFLEGAWAALEDAGLDPGRRRRAIGIVAGVGNSDYFLHNVLPNRAKLQGLDPLQIRLANSADSLATLASYKLDLGGPSFTVQTACSSSLVAVHLACQSLLNGECDVMVAGGVNLTSSAGYLHQEGGILSSDGHCRAFDRSANGTVPGSGLGIVVLKRLEDALDDGDTVRAVILGSAINNDGAAKAGYTAPSVMGHARVVTEALAVAGVAADSISYVEAHGTGTEVGDPIEIEGLTAAFRETTAGRGFCGIGSVKTNIGHLDHAAGVVGLIKCVLALEKRRIPPSLHFKQPNPKIDFASTPFYVVRQMSDWSPPSGQRRRAGVSSLGIGGTNAHMVLEEAPSEKVERAVEPPRPELVVVSARSEAALQDASSRLAAHLRESSAPSLADVAFTLRDGRRRFTVRRAFVARTREEAISRLEADAGIGIVRGSEEQLDDAYVFLFPGRASRQAVPRGIYRRFSRFREELDRGARHAEPLLLESHDDLRLLIVQLALARLWMSFGITPRATVGEGVGEITARCLSGDCSLEEATELVARGEIPRRSRLAEELEGLPVNERRAFIEMGSGTFSESIPFARSGHRESLFVASLPDASRADESAESGSEEETLLRAVGELWLRGAVIEHEALDDEPRRHVPLPTYPFERRRFWLEAPGLAAPAAPAPATTRKSGPPEWLYLPVFRSYHSPKPRLREVDARKRERFLFLDDEGVTSRLVASRLADLGHEIVGVSWGETFERLEDGRYVLRPDAKEDYLRLVAELKTRGQLPTAVAHFWTLCPGAGDGLASLRALGLESLIHLSAAIGEEGGQDEGRVRLHFVSSGLESLSAGEALSAEKRMALAVLPVIGQEYPGLSASALDVLVPEESPEDARELVERIADELTRVRRETSVALRGEFRHVVTYERLSSIFQSEVDGSEPLLRTRGTYLVTGGLGQLGLAIAEHLARKVKANLVLVSRTAPPERDTWEASLMSASPASMTTTVERRIRGLLRIESLGSEILVVPADVADEEQMTAAVEAAEARFGAIHGVIHAAGVLDAGTLTPLKDVSAGEIDRQLRPKVAALPVLERALGDRSLDFVLLMSSLSTTLGGVGYGVYAAANAFMDAFAVEKRRRGTRIPWLSVDWDAWRAADVPSRASGYGSELSRLALSHSEGLETLELILSLGEVPRAVVSTADLNERIERWSGLAPSSSDRRPSAEQTPSRHPRPSLGSVYVAPGTEAETQLCELWGGLLGVEPVGIHDNFFELGGSSLLAIQLMSRIEREMGVKMPTTAIFEGPTVRTLSELVLSRSGGGGGSVAAVGAAKGELG